MSTEALKPCPFCGGPATMECDDAGGYARFSAGCCADEPTCMGYQSLTTFNRRSEAVTAWNVRATSEEAILPGTDNMEKRFAWLQSHAADMGYNLIPTQPTDNASAAPSEGAKA